MAIHRTFLPWDKPCLTQACDWLLAQQSEADSHHSHAGEIDLSDWALVLPTARAGRRLLELLVASTDGRAMVPPRILTLNQLPDFLLPDANAAAGDLICWMTRAQVLQQTPAEDLKALLPQPPARHDAIGHLLLARDLQQIDDELASCQLTLADVAQHIHEGIYDDRERWDVLAQLQAGHEQALTAMGLADRRTIHRKLLARGDAAAADAWPGRLVLVSVPELTPQVAALVSRRPSRVDVLVHAPANESKHFDELGRLDVNHWTQRGIRFNAGQVHMVDRPADQAMQVARVIDSISPLPEAQQVAVGLGDSRLAPFLSQAMQSAGVPTRHVEGRRMSQSAPAVMLQEMATLLNHMTLRELATLTRCPCVHDWLMAKLADRPAISVLLKEQPLLGWLDQYIHDHLGQRLSSLDDSPSADDAGRVVYEAWAAIAQLLPQNHDQPAPLADWSPAIVHLLQSLFGLRELERYDVDDAFLIRAIQLIAQVLEQHAALQQATQSSPLPINSFTLAQAIELLLLELAGQLIPPEAGEPATELIAWRELRLDDAPHAIVTSFNEGNIPQHQNHHWLLPDTLRKQLGLQDNRNTYAHDAYALAAVMHSSRTLDVILQRQDAQGDPLTPSRLLLAGDDAGRSRWIESFYNHSAQQATGPLFLVPAARSTFQVPKPLPLAKPITSLRVTAFADYLACPYRFYLKHVLRLRTLDDRAREMDALGFGNLAHDILHAFGCSELAHSSNFGDIEQYLTDHLQQNITRQFGSNPPAVIRIQQEILRQRLVQLAQWQAGENQIGWRIDPAMVERDVHVTLMVDDQPFEIHGRIDRCDHHPEQGHRLLDYKTSEAAQSPEKVHQQQGKWKNLQLPLYDILGRQGLNLQGQLALGYVLLPNDLAKVGLAEAPWDEAALAEAMEVARDVIRCIRQEKFFPPSRDLHADEFSDLCMENVLDAGITGDQP